MESVVATEDFLMPEPGIYEDTNDGDGEDRETGENRSSDSNVDDNEDSDRLEDRGSVFDRIDHNAANNGSDESKEDDENATVSDDNGDDGNSDADDEDDDDEDNIDSVSATRDENVNKDDNSLDADDDQTKDSVKDELENKVYDTCSTSPQSSTFVVNNSNNNANTLALEEADGDEVVVTLEIPSRRNRRLGLNHSDLPSEVVVLSDDDNDDITVISSEVPVQMVNTDDDDDDADCVVSMVTNVNDGSPLEQDTTGNTLREEFGGRLSSSFSLEQQADSNLMHITLDTLSQQRNLPEDLSTVSQASRSSHHTEGEGNGDGVVFQRLNSSDNGQQEQCMDVDVCSNGRGESFCRDDSSSDSSPVDSCSVEVVKIRHIVPDDVRRFECKTTSTLSSSPVPSVSSIVRGIDSLFDILPLNSRSSSSINSSSLDGSVDITECTVRLKKFNAPLSSIRARPMNDLINKLATEGRDTEARQDVHALKTCKITDRDTKQTSRSSALDHITNMSWCCADNKQVELSDTGLPDLQIKQQSSPKNDERKPRSWSISSSSSIDDDADAGNTKISSFLMQDTTSNPTKAGSNNEESTACRLVGASSSVSEPVIHRADCWSGSCIAKVGGSCSAKLSANDSSLWDAVDNKSSNEIDDFLSRQNDDLMLQQDTNHATETGDDESWMTVSRHYGRMRSSPRHFNRSLSSISNASSTAVATTHNPSDVGCATFWGMREQQMIETKKQSVDVLPSLVSHDSIVVGDANMSYADRTEEGNDQLQCCYKCLTITVQDKLSFCMGGCACCKSCLEAQVKTLLTKENPGALVCQNNACNEYYLAYQLRNTLPEMVVEILETKLDRHCYDNVSKALLDEVGEELLGVDAGHGGITDKTDTSYAALKCDKKVKDKKDDVKDKKDDLMARPGFWAEMSPTEHYTLVDIYSDSSEYIWVSTLFYESMAGAKITSIQRVQNPILWQFYEVKKKEIQRYCCTPAASGGPNDRQPLDRNDIERHLFHGTKRSVIPSICANSFDWRHCGTHGTAYGMGSYFARDASYSHMYTDNGRVSHPPGHHHHRINVAFAALRRQYGLYDPTASYPQAPGIANVNYNLQPLQPPPAHYVPLIPLNNYGFSTATVVPPSRAATASASSAADASTTSAAGTIQVNDLRPAARQRRMDALKSIFQLNRDHWNSQAVHPEAGLPSGDNSSADSTNGNSNRNKSRESGVSSCKRKSSSPLSSIQLSKKSSTMSRVGVSAQTDICYYASNESDSLSAGNASNSLSASNSSNLQPRSATSSSQPAINSQPGSTAGNSQPRSTAGNSHSTTDVIVSQLGRSKRPGNRWNTVLKLELESDESSQSFDALRGSDTTGASQSLFSQSVSCHFTSLQHSADNTNYLSSSDQQPSKSSNVGSTSHKSSRDVLQPIKSSSPGSKTSRLPSGFDAICRRSAQRTAAHSTSAQSSTDLLAPSPHRSSGNLPSWLARPLPPPAHQQILTNEPNESPPQNIHAVFLAKVLVGRSTLGRPDYRKPPPIDPSLPYGRSYDSCVNNEDSPTIVVVFHTAQAYPEYVIEYTYEPPATVPK